MEFRNKICVITGGANGIGRCIALEFIRAGAKVAVIDPDQKTGNRLASEHEGFFFYRGNAAVESDLRSFSNEVLSKFGHVDFLINNACITRGGILSGCGYDDFNFVLRVGITAPYLLSLLFRDTFGPGASIVNIASTRAFMSQADTESYSAAKGGIVALTHALSVSLAGKVRVNCVAPGWIETAEYYDGGSEPSHSAGDNSQHPAGRVGRPSDIARAVMFLCGDGASFITGETLTVDGGMTKLMIYNSDGGWIYEAQPDK